MEKIILYSLENWMKNSAKSENAVIYGAPSEALLALQEQGQCVLAELSHLQGLSEQEIADALSKETVIEQYQHVCINAAELSQAYLRRIRCQSAGIPVVIAETDRLLIRESVPEDAEGFRRLYEDVVCKRFLELPPVSQSEDSSYQSYIRKYMHNQYAFFEYGMWTVLEKKSGAFAGRMGLESFSDEALSLGYALLPEFRGMGYALEACRAILAYCVECSYTDCVVIKANTENTDSVKLAQRLQEQNDTDLELRIIVK